MQNNSRWTRSAILKRLASRKLTVRRIAGEGDRRVWLVSDGSKYESLAQIAKAYPPFSPEKVKEMEKKKETE
jgi:hypothetical protein